MRSAVEEPDVPVCYSPKFREFGISVLDGGSSEILLGFCPWCGNKLPESLRDRWFFELEGRGIDPTTDVVPVEYTDERWWRAK